MENNRKIIEPLTLTNMSIPYNTETWHPRNFQGQKIGQYNKEGDRNFCIFLDPTQVDCEKLIEDGWNIKVNRNERDPEAEPSYMLRVKVKYHPDDSDLKRLNPKILMVNSKGEMVMDEGNVGDLDNAQIIKANLTIKGRWSESSTYTGITAYLSRMVVRVYEDEESLDDLKAGIMDD